MDIKNRPDVLTVMTVSLVRGCAFALITLCYTWIGGLFEQYLWCVYIGFFLSMALGVRRERGSHYICSAMIGYAWAFLYMNLGKWFVAFLGMTPMLSVVLAEFFLTFILLVVHLLLFSKTRANTIPAVFASIAAVYASGSIVKIPYCAIGMVIGISMAYGTEKIISCILSYCSQGNSM